jgi:hypothetical protein
MSIQEKLIFTDINYDPSYNEGQGFKLVERDNRETRRTELCAEFKLAAAVAETFDGETIAQHTKVTLAEDELKNRINFFLKKQNAGDQTPDFEIKVLRKLQEAKAARRAAVPA